MIETRESPVTWLSALATGLANGRKPGHISTSVWSLATARGPALIATDGKVLAAYSCPDAAAQAPSMPSGEIGTVVSWLDGPGKPLGRLDMAHLREWCLPPDPASAGPCAACKGTGKLVCDECSGTGEVECDYGHEHDCEDCEATGIVACNRCGEGKMPPAEKRPCKIGSLTMDRNVILLVPAQLTGPALAEVIPQGSYGAQCLRLSGEGWVALAMPLSGDSYQAPVYPLTAQHSSS